MIKAQILIGLVDCQGQSVIVQIQSEEENHAANPASDIRQSTSYHSSTGTSESNKDGLCRELSQSGCAICLIEFDNSSNIPQLSCGHPFHEHCISGWLESNQAGHLRCPTCRAELRQAEGTESASTLPNAMELNPVFWARLEEKRKEAESESIASLLSVFSETVTNAMIQFFEYRPCYFGHRSLTIGTILTILSLICLFVEFTLLTMKILVVS
jgi:hypothetical protein